LVNGSWGRGKCDEKLMASVQGQVKEEKALSQRSLKERSARTGAEGLSLGSKI